MNQNIIDQSFKLFPQDEDNLADDINAVKRSIFRMGAERGAQDVVDRIHKALKGLRLDTHGVALNVLRIANIKLPKDEK